MKKCSKCFETKDFSEFSKDKHQKDGLTTSCRLCRRAATAKWRSLNPDKVQEYKKSEGFKEIARKSSAKWRKNNPEKLKEYYAKESTKENSRKRTHQYYLRNKRQQHHKFREWRKNNPEKEISRRAEYYRLNTDKVKEYTRFWYSKNKQRFVLYAANRRARKLQATPKWVDLDQIKQIYANCPKGYHVDHIVPLRNPKVSGLHVPWNLQYLTAQENLSKNNKFQWEPAGNPLYNFAVLLYTGEALNAK